LFLLAAIVEDLIISSQNNSRYIKRKKVEEMLLERMDEEEKKKFREGKKSKSSYTGVRNTQAQPIGQKTTERVCIRQDTVSSDLIVILMLIMFSIMLIRLRNVVIYLTILHYSFVR
jgi:hypothetical protein